MTGVTPARHTFQLAALLTISLSLACAQSAPRATAGHPLTAEEATAVHRLLAEAGADGPLSPRLEERVAFFVAKLRQKDLPAIAARQKQVWPVIQRELSAAHLPEWLGAMAYVESHFDPGVRGGASCAGLWQFTAPTARRFSLRVEEAAGSDAQADERLDPEKSSRAAAQYLSALLAEFGPGSLLVALASYNAGEHALHAAIERSTAAGGEAPADFWTLDQRGLLSEETSAYVPQILAAAILLPPPR